MTPLEEELPPGPDVDLDKTPNPLWKEIQNDELTISNLKKIG